MGYTTADLQQLSTNIFIINGHTTVGVLLDQDSICLIDSGANADDGMSILRVLDENFPGKKIEMIINTQGQSDHCGGNRTIQAATKCQIWAPEGESHLIEYPQLYPSICWGGNPFDELYSELLSQEAPSYPNKKIKSKSFSMNSTNLTFMDLPGHFLDQKGILVEDKSDFRKVFFLGDSFYGVKMLIKLWIPFMLDPQQFRDSVDIIEKTQADIFIPAHGGLCKKENIAEIAEFNKLVTLETEALILKLLHKSHLTQDQILKEAADYSGISLNLKQLILAESTIRSYLASMKKRNLVTFIIENNQMLWMAK